MHIYILYVRIWPCALYNLSVALQSQQRLAAEAEVAAVEAQLAKQKRTLLQVCIYNMRRAFHGFLAAQTAAKDYKQFGIIITYSCILLCRTPHKTHLMLLGHQWACLTSPHNLVLIFHFYLLFFIY